MKKKLNYKLGTWFAVPLPNGGYGVGVVARASGRGGVLGYFFGPKRDAVPAFQEICNLQPEQAVLIAQFGDPGFLRNEWPILGDDPSWQRATWPMPPFIYVDDISGKAWLRYYDEDRIERMLRQERCDPALAKTLPEDGCHGYISLSIVLEQKLTPVVH